jgi:hypothetical protein
MGRLAHIIALPKRPTGETHGESAFGGQLDGTGPGRFLLRAPMSVASAGGRAA